MKQNLKRLLPVSIVIGITIIISILVYYNVMNREEKRCWQLLSDSAEAATNEIRMKFQDNITTLGLAANTMIQENKLEPDQLSSVHLDSFEENTLFSRIDVIYPDNTIFLENGTKKTLRDDVSFDDIAALGEHISSRMTDLETGNESVYYFIPVEKDDEIKAILTGVIDTTVLPEIFKITLYDGHAAYCIVDSTDGNYIMDTWHEELGNAYENPDRTPLKGYESVNLKEDVQNQKTGAIAFESRTNGEDTYMYYTPVGLFNWEFLITSQKNVVFSSLLYLKKLMIYVGLIESILLVLYFIWNFYTVEQLSKSQKQTREQLEISNTLIQCVTELSSDKDIDISIQNLLIIINQYFNSDRTYIFETDQERKILINTYEYSIHGVSPQIENLQEVPISCVSHWMEAFDRFEPYYISDLKQEMKYDSYDILKAQDINQLITVPLGKKGHVIGFVGVDNPKRFYNDATLLSSIQFFLTNSLATKKQQEQLRYMSYRDMLTCLYNRNKYIQILDSYKETGMEKAGAAYIDLNGLKQINDQKGHKAGDVFICNAAKVISCYFPENSYRIGGDEFVILVGNIEEQEFLQKIEKLKKTTEKEQVSVSIGYVWQDSCPDIEAMLKDADKRMYEAKKRYYQTADRRARSRE